MTIGMVLERVGMLVEGCPNDMEGVVDVGIMHGGSVMLLVTFSINK